MKDRKILNKTCENKISKHTREFTEINKELLFEKNKFEAILSSMADGLFTIDDKFCITSFNRAAEEITGYKKEEVIGKPCRYVIHGELCHRVSCALNKSRKTGKPHLNVRTFIKSKKGGLIYILASTSVLKDKDGNFIGGVETFHDMTELYKIEREKNKLIAELQNINKELDRLNKIKTEFISVVSHELRTPLTAIKGYSELLKNNKYGKITNTQNKILSLVIKKSDQLNKLIVQLLDLSRIELGKFELKKEPVELDKVIENSLENFQSIIKEKQIKYKLNLLKEPVWVIGNNLRLIEVMDNLIGNAVKFTPSKGRITISFRKLQGNIEVSVQDTGQGIPKEEFNNIFESFYQIDSSSTRKYAGTGLGLAIVKHIINRHNGKIWVENELNKGSKFIFTLPMAEKESIVKIQNILGGETNKRRV
ncbi:MAG: ATP-binding protein [bacterium]